MFECRIVTSFLIDVLKERTFAEAETDVLVHVFAA